MDYSRTVPKRNGNFTKILATCENCQSNFYEKKSSFEKNIRHFCCRACYADFRKNKMPFHEQNSYNGIRKQGESKQIYHKRYVEKHPELISHLKARRYAREKGADGSHTLAEWEALKKSFNNKCCNCFSDRPLTKDHIVPLSKGGSDYITNIAPLCRRCNSKKYNHLIGDSNIFPTISPITLIPSKGDDEDLSNGPDLKLQPS